MNTEQWVKEARKRLDDPNIHVKVIEGGILEVWSVARTGEPFPIFDVRADDGGPRYLYERDIHKLHEMSRANHMGSTRAAFHWIRNLSYEYDRKRSKAEEDKWERVRRESRDYMYHRLGAVRSIGVKPTLGLPIIRNPARHVIARSTR